MQVGNKADEEKLNRSEDIFVLNFNDIGPFPSNACDMKEDQWFVGMFS